MSTTGLNHKQGQGGSKPILEAWGLTKQYGATRALKGTNLTLYPQLIYGLIGANGAGKSTLIRILSGAERPDSGELLIDGLYAELQNTIEAEQKGIVTVHQDPSVVDQLSVFDNLYLGHEPYKFKVPHIVSELSERAHDVCRNVGLHVPLQTRVRHLSVGERQLVCIARSLLLGVPRLLILDEPTASLSSGESDALFVLVNQLVDKGASVLITSHRLGEILTRTQIVAVLRDGDLVVSNEKTETVTIDTLVKAMIGTKQRDSKNRDHYDDTLGQKVNELGSRNKERKSKDQEVIGTFKDIAGNDLLLRKGIIIGIYGVVGCGAPALLEALAMTENHNENQIVSLPKRSQIAFTPGDRIRDGIFEELTSLDNVIINVDRRIARYKVFKNETNELSVFRKIVQAITLTPGEPHVQAKVLSGGNQQKLIIGRVLAQLTIQKLVLWILIDPTVGVDVVARNQIHTVLKEIASKGICILLYSSDLEEIKAISSEIMVIRDGNIVLHDESDNLNVSTLLELAHGIE